MNRQKRKEPEAILESSENEIAVDDIDLGEDFSLDEENGEDSANIPTRKTGTDKIKKAARPKRVRKQPTITMSAKPLADEKEPKLDAKASMPPAEKVPKEEIAEESDKTGLESQPPVTVELPKVTPPLPKKNEKAPLEIPLQQDGIAPTTPMAKEWGAVRDVSASVSENLQQVANQLKDLQANYQVAVQDARKQSNLRPSFVTKIAMAASVIALIFSFISLSLAQSARQALINDEAFHESAKIDSVPRPLSEKRAAENKQTEKKLADKRLQAALLREKALAALDRDQVRVKPSLTAKKSIKKRLEKRASP